MRKIVVIKSHVDRNYIRNNFVIQFLIIVKIIVLYAKC